MSEEREEKDAADDIVDKTPQPMFGMPNPSKPEQPRGKYEMPQGFDMPQGFEIPQPGFVMPQGRDDHGDYVMPQGKIMPQGRDDED